MRHGSHPSSLKDRLFPSLRVSGFTWWTPGRRKTDPAAWLWDSNVDLVPQISNELLAQRDELPGFHRLGIGLVIATFQCAAASL